MSPYAGRRRCWLVLWLTVTIELVPWLHFLLRFYSPASSPPTAAITLQLPHQVCFAAALIGAVISTRARIALVLLAGMPVPAAVGLAAQRDLLAVAVAKRTRFSRVTFGARRRHHDPRSPPLRRPPVPQQPADQRRAQRLFTVLFTIVIRWHGPSAVSACSPIRTGSRRARKEIPNLWDYEKEEDA